MPAPSETSTLTPEDLKDLESATIEDYYGSLSGDFTLKLVELRMRTVILRMNPTGVYLSSRCCTSAVFTAWPPPRQELAYKSTYREGGLYCSSCQKIVSKELMGGDRRQQLSDVQKILEEILRPFYPPLELLLAVGEAADEMERLLKEALTQEIVPTWKISRS